MKSWKSCTNWKNEFGDVIIQVGSIDCATKKSVQEIIENYEIIEVAKQVSSTGHVTLGGISPRTNDGDAAARGTERKSRLQQLAEARDDIHIDHGGTFLLKNGEVNTVFLLLDGLHLSEVGSKALLSNLKLSSKANVRLGRGIRDRRPSRSFSSPHDPQQHGTSSADHRPSPNGHFSHGHSTRRNVWGLIPHAGHQQSYQLRTNHSQPSRRDRIKDPRRNAYRGRVHCEGERGESRSFVNNENPHRDSSKRCQSPNESRSRQPRCWYCNERGHPYRQCYHGHSVECRDFGQLGHKSKHCESFSYEY